MKNIKLFEDINFDDIDYEEYNYDNDDIKVGNKVLPKDGHTSLRTIESHTHPKHKALKRGNINGEYELKKQYGTRFNIVDEIEYKNDGTKLIRFKGQWPYHVSSYWKKVNINESINFDDIDDEEFNIPEDFIGHEDFYNFLVDNDALDKYLYNINKSIFNVKKFFDNNSNLNYFNRAFPWSNTKEGNYFWKTLSVNWKNKK